MKISMKNLRKTIRKVIIESTDLSAQEAANLGELLMSTDEETVRSGIELAESLGLIVDKWEEFNNVGWWSCWVETRYGTELFKWIVEWNKHNSVNTKEVVISIGTEWEGDIKWDFYSESPVWEGKDTRAAVWDGE